MRLNTKKLAVVTVFAALYAVGVVFLAPISFGIVQVRVADAMLPLAMIFGLPGALGLSLGCLVSNVFGGLGIVDIVGGATANLVACTLAWYIGRKGRGAQRFLGTVADNSSRWFDCWRIPLMVTSGSSGNQSLRSTYWRNDSGKPYRLPPRRSNKTKQNF